MLMILNFDVGATVSPYEPGCSGGGYEMQTCKANRLDNTSGGGWEHTDS